MKKIIFLGLLSFLAAALWQLPLSFANPYLVKYVKGVTLEDVSGTVWNGEAKHLFANDIDFEKVKWSVKPLQSLTSFSLKFDFDIQGRDLTANGLAGITLNKTLILDKTKFDLNASYLNTQQRFAMLSGDIKGNIKHAEINQKDLPIVNGTIDWKEAALNSPIKLTQGDYHAVITPDAGDMNIKLSSSDAPVELAGTIKLNKEWLYDTDLKIKSADPSIISMIGMIGEKQADDMVNIKQKGDLKPYLGKTSQGKKK